MSARGYISLVLLAALAALALGGCSGDTNANEKAPELLAPVGVASDIAYAERGEYYNLKHYDAAVYAHVESLYLTVDAVVKEVVAHPGDRVSKGDALIMLNVDSARERAEALTESIEYNKRAAQYEDEIAMLGIEILKVELERLIATRADDTQAALKRLEIEQAEANLRHKREVRAVEWERDAAELAQLNKTLEVDAIYAPFDGVVARRIELSEGSRINAYEPVAYVADDTRLRISSDYISETIFRSANGGYYALIGDKRYEIEQVPLDVKDYISRLLAGKKTYTEFNFKGGAEAIADIEAGMYAAVVFVTNYTPDALLVPAGAVLNDANGKYVYIANDDGSRKRRDIRVKAGLNERMTQVLEGLEEGERIYVTDK